MIQTWEHSEYRCKSTKIVGNSSVFGNNSPNVGNSSLGVGTKGGQWYFAQESQDEYFSLGRITTAGYDQVVETTGCSIIGSQTVTVTMRETKLRGAPQHNHTVFHSIPGTEEWVKEGSGDRYLVDYRSGSGRIARWYPTTGTVFTQHGLLRVANTDNTVATYDVLDFQGGAGGNGSIKDQQYLKMINTILLLVQMVLDHMNSRHIFQILHSSDSNLHLLLVVEM